MAMYTAEQIKEFSIKPVSAQVLLLISLAPASLTQSA